MSDDSSWRRNKKMTTAPTTTGTTTTTAATVRRRPTLALISILFSLALDWTSTTASAEVASPGGLIRTPQFEPWGEDEDRIGGDNPYETSVDRYSVLCDPVCPTEPGAVMSGQPGLPSLSFPGHGSRLGPQRADYIRHRPMRSPGYLLRTRKSVIDADGGEDDDEDDAGLTAALNEAHVLVGDLTSRDPAAVATDAGQIPDRSTRSGQYLFRSRKRSGAGRNPQVRDRKGSYYFRTRRAGNDADGDRKRASYYFRTRKGQKGFRSHRYYGTGDKRKGGYLFRTRKSSGPEAEIEPKVADRQGYRLWVQRLMDNWMQNFVSDSGEEPLARKLRGQSYLFRT